MGGAKRIAYLISCYPSLSHTFILREIHTLRKLGWDIQVASINTPDRSINALTTEEQQEASKTWYVKAQPRTVILGTVLKILVTRPGGFFRGVGAALMLGGGGLTQRLYNLFYFIEALLVGNWMASHQIRHLHVHFLNPASTVALLLSKIFPITISITAHGPDEFFEVSKNELEKKITASLFVSCISYFARSQLMRVSQPTQWDKLEVLPLGVDPSVFTLQPHEPSNIFHILSVGRLVPTKGQELLLDVIEQLVREDRDVHLRLVGDGPSRVRLEQAVRERKLESHVSFEGPVDQNRIRDYFSTADVFVLPSFAEGVPVVLMEAMAMGVPCVASAIAGIPELIRHDEEGLLVASSDVSGMVSAISKLMDNPPMRERLGRAARQRVMEKYNLQLNTTELASVFEKRLSID